MELVDIPDEPGGFAVHTTLTLIYDGLLTHLPADLLAAAIVASSAALAKAFKRHSAK